MAVAAPRDLTAARERLLSLGNYGSDLSVRYRLTESRHVIDEIRAQPLVGSGLGATILWGRAYEGVRPSTESFAHNGYLWLAWKLGAPAAGLSAAPGRGAALWRRPAGRPHWRRRAAAPRPRWCCCCSQASRSPPSRRSASRP